MTAISQVRLDEFERFHASKIAHNLPKVTIREFFTVIAVALFMAPFTVVTFGVIPVMGQVTVGLTVTLTVLYLYYRRSLVVTIAAVGSTMFFWTLLFVTIQTIKNNLELPLFFFTATGIPVSAMYAMFVASRIWIIRGGVE